MANLTYRQSIQESPSSTTTKNATLTSQEIDGNFKSLNDELITKAPLVSPGFSGVPTAPTATAGANTTQLATTAFVQTGLSTRQPLDAELTAISGLSTNGLITRTGASTAESRSIAVSGTGLSVTNADGIAGNPTVTSNATAANTALTIVARDASGNFSAGTITAALAGNAATATTLQTARTINGTNFNGSANITTANWGTSRTLTIGGSGKAVNGSGNVAWSLTEIGAIPAAEKGVANGVATLDSSGLVPASQLPSYVDDVLEYAALASFPVTGELAKIYVALDTNKIYRWSGSAYIEISPVVGNADTATKLATARTISLTGDVTGSVSFDGSANASITTTIAPNSVALGTDTTGNYVVGATAGNYILVSGTAGEGWSPTIAVNATPANTASKVVARDASGNFSAGTITAALAGNALTASELQTARTILLTGDVTGSTSFNGSQDVTLTATIAPNSVALGTDTTGNYVAGLTQGTGIAVTGTAGEGWSPTVSLATVGTAGTYTKVTTDAYGRVTSGTTLSATDIPALDASKITTGALANARLAGTYSGFTHKIGGANTVFTTPSSGTTSTAGRTVYGLAEYKSTSTSQVGAIVFIAPNTSTSIMHLIEVSALLHNQSIVSMQVQGHRTTGSWSSTRKVSTGTADIQVRWGVTPDGKNCLILGDVVTAWSYPHVSITKAMFSHTGVIDEYCTGWTVAVVTDLSAYTQVTSAIADSAITGSVTGNAATATKLATARTISLTGDVTGSVSFDGDDDVILETAVANNSHSHLFSDITTTPTTIQGYGIAPESMSSGVNLNTKTSTGWFSQGSNVNATLLLNYPVTQAGLLEVFAYGGSMIHQRYWVYNSDDVYYRAKYSTGAWTAWVKSANVNDNVATATKLATARTISLTGDVTGSVSFDGDDDVILETTVGDDSHNHVIANVDGLQTALDGKVAKDSGTGSAALPAGTTAQRSEVPAAGALRFNITLKQFEGYDGTAWGAVSKPDSSIVSFQQAGTGAVLRTAQDKMREWVSVKDFMSAQDLADIASGTQSSSVRTAVKRAVAYINTVGGTLYFPPGHYNSPYLTHTDTANWIEITKSGVSLVAAPGSVTLENFLFYVHGAYGAPQIVGAAGFTTGDTQINTATAHNLVAGDYVQLLTGINAYTTDAGVWQLGSQNPTTLETNNCLHSEIHRVFSVPSSTTATLYDNIIYANYKNNTTGQSFPISGVTGARIRKLTPIIGVLFDGIVFKNVNNDSFRGVMVRSAVDVTFNRCRFEATGRPGSHFKSTDVLNLKFIDCTSYRSPTGASGSSWNSFFPGGGSQNVVFQGCHFLGEHQSIDVTPNLHSSDIGYTGAAIGVEYLTTQIISISGCLFTKCSDGMTTHPGTYNLNASDNVFEGCSTGLRVRSKKITIVGNTFRTYRGGVTLSAFYEDTLITGNNFEQLPQKVSEPWVGVSFVPLSSEIMNNNNFENVTVVNNVFKVVQANSSNAGVQFYQSGNGVPANAGFTRFTDTIKTNLSAYHIAQNQFVGCSATVSRWINGVTFSENSFSGGSDRTHYILCNNDSARHTLNLNIFKDSIVPAFSVGTATNPTFPYNTQHRIGYQFGALGGVTGDANNSTGLFMYGFGHPVLDGVRVQNAQRVEAVRASSAATLRLDAVAQDGVSNVEVRVFDQNTTTGTKTLAVTGRVTSEHCYPRTDNTYNSGLSAYRWSVVYAATGTINTSDAREKQQVRDLSAAERAVAIRLKSLVRAFKFNDAVEAKGEGARIHFGVLAQDVKAAFEAEGLVAEDYALFCYDEWDEELDEDGNIITPAGERYGIRYEELLAFVLGAL